MQEKLLKKIHQLGIEELKTLTALNILDGNYINLECRLPNGTVAKILDDNKKYYGNQVEQKGTDKCFGVAADENQIAVYRYGCGGSNAELILWVRL